MSFSAKKLSAFKSIRTVCRFSLRMDESASSVLVIGADGLHSNVRRLVFGSQDEFEKQLGYVVAAFEVRGYRPRDEGVYVIYSEPGRMLGRFALHDDRTLFLFLFAGTVDPQPTKLDLPTQ